MGFGYGFNYGFGLKDYEPPISSVPSAITDFSATDNEVGQVTVIFSPASGYPTPTYNLINITDATTEATGISSGYIHSVVASTKTYRVDAVNSEGTTPSNTDSGTSISEGETVLVVSVNGLMIEEQA